MPQPKPGNVFNHYKGGLYRVLTIARNTETDEDMVIYLDVLTPSKVWARPMDSWMKKASRDGETVERFRLVPGVELEN